MSFNYPSWRPDECPDDGIYADCGSYFTERGIKAPQAHRITLPFSSGHAFTIESYSRVTSRKAQEFFAVVNDPSGKANKVLRIVSPTHNDATVVRNSEALPPQYKICLDVGYPSFGNGDPDPSNLNGYLGGETSEPWSARTASKENGFYWLAILDSVPRPHNNIWIHHHRKIVIDTDNNKTAWTSIWNGREFVESGRQPVMMFGLSKVGRDDSETGLPYITYAAGEVQKVGLTRAADSYLETTWYHVCVEKSSAAFTLQISGKFKYGGETRYRGSVPLDRIYHATDTPDYFMFGDPHNNFYRGAVYYDNIELSVPAP
jgi:hypothetical protein